MNETEYQSDLIAKITSLAPYSDSLDIYQRNWFYASHRALTTTLPTLENILTRKELNSLCHKLLQTMPKSDYDWAQWIPGAAFTVNLQEWLKENNLLKILPFLIDLTRLDTALFIISRKFQPKINLESLAQLNDMDLSNTYLKLSPCFEIIQSHWDLTLLRKKITEGEYLRNSQVVRHDENLSWMIYRQDNQPYIEILSRQETHLMASLKSKCSVERLFYLCTESNIDFSQWLAHCLQTKIITCACDAYPSELNHE